MEIGKKVNYENACNVLQLLVRPRAGNGRWSTVKMMHISNYHSVVPDRNDNTSSEVEEKAKVEMIAVKNVACYIKQTELQIFCLFLNCFSW